MNRARVSVVKVGGSLLASAEMPRRLRAWLAMVAEAHTDSHYVLVVGGGKLVDAVREIDSRTPLGDEQSHWISIKLMGVSTQIASAMLPELRVVTSFVDLQHRLREPGVTLFCVCQFLKQIEPTCAGAKLAHDWSVTSDAIAGRLTIVLEADELILLKSNSPPKSLDHKNELDGWANAGYVDAFLPTLAAVLPEYHCITI